MMSTYENYLQSGIEKEIFSKTHTFLRYFHYKYMRGGMNRASWCELVIDATTTKKMKLDLVVSVLARGDMNEAVYWARFFGVRHTDVPRSLAIRLRQKPKFEPYIGQKDANSNSFLKLSIPLNRVLMVNSKVHFLEMLAWLERQQLVAFDSEWKPTCLNDSVIALLQLATGTRVFLVDCLSPKLDAELWSMLGDKVFNNLEILKIGFAIQDDLNMLKNSLPEMLLRLGNAEKEHYLDICELWKFVERRNLMTLPYESVPNGRQSLSALAEMSLGKKLDKSNQVSNWARRPLRPDQFVYAALDAHCVVQIYRVFVDALNNAGHDVIQVVNHVIRGSNGSQFSNNRNRRGHNGDAAIREVADNRPPLKFICDHMLNHLGRELRKLGLDTVTVIRSKAMDYYVSMSQRENRIVVSCGERGLLFQRALPRNMCVVVARGNLENQALRVIRQLDITVREQNLYTRCATCNGTNFIFATRNEMHVICFGQLLRSNYSPVVKPPNHKLNLVRPSSTFTRNRTTNCGKQIKFLDITKPVLRTKNYFYICDSCGYCTWEGASPVNEAVLDAVGCKPQQNAGR